MGRVLLVGCRFVSMRSTKRIELRWLWLLVFELSWLPEEGAPSGAKMNTPAAFDITTLLRVYENDLTIDPVANIVDTTTLH